MEYIKEGWWETNIHVASVKNWEFKFVCLQENGEVAWEQGENRKFPPENVVPVFQRYVKFYHCNEMWQIDSTVTKVTVEDEEKET